jgi:LacI family transcriptional regulator
MGCTVNDLARAAGVSRSTVLRALSRKPDISRETGARIRKLAAAMKYRPNSIARSLTQGRTKLVGVIANPSIYYASHSIIEAVGSGLRDGGYSMLLFASDGEHGGDESVIEQLLENRVDGAIAVPGASAAPATYHELVDADVKLVILDGLIEDLPAPQISGDNYKAGRLAAEHLVGLGHRHIVYLGIPSATAVGRERLRGVRDAFEAARLPARDDMFQEIAFSESDAQKHTARLLESAPRPTALLVRHDVAARGAMRAIYAAGLSVPDDISIVGNGDILGSDMFRVPLTTVRFPARRMADLCVRTVLDMLAGRRVAPRTMTLDVELIVRASTAPPRQS